MRTPAPFPAEGGCDCRYVRYRLPTAPMVVHCCHCRWCQRETGASFALNAMYEADRVLNLAGEPMLVDTPSASGVGQKVARCPRCRVAVWSHYAGSGLITRFVRVGTLDQPDVLPPDVHIFTASKQPWVVIPPGAPAFDEFYDREAVWPRASLARLAVLMPRIEAYRAGLALDHQPKDASVKRMDNVLIVVDDLEAVKAFFVELGLRLEGQSMVEGPPVGKLIGLDDVHATLAMLRTPDGQGIELDKFHRPDAIRFGPVDAPVNALGLRRIMFAVDDIDAVVARMQSHGAELVGRMQYGQTYRLAYIRGPEGIVVGLAEQLG